MNEIKEMREISKMLRKAADYMDEAAEETEKGNEEEAEEAAAKFVLKMTKIFTKIGEL